MWSWERRGAAGNAVGSVFFPILSLVQFFFNLLWFTLQCWNSALERNEKYKIKVTKAQQKPKVESKRNNRNSEMGLALVSFW